MPRDFFGLRPAAHCGNGRPVASGAAGLDVEIERDPVTGSCQWFHFQVFGDAGFTVRIVNAHASSYPGGWEDCVVWRRAGRRAWLPMPATSEAGVVSFVHEADGAASYALFPPLPEARLARLAAQVAARPDGVVDAGRPGEAPATRLTFGDPDPKARQIWIICGQHGSEHPALWFAEGLAGALLRWPRLPAGKRFHLVPVANPGGMRAGHLRTNATGQDPNRHWAAWRNAQCLEVSTLADAIERLGVDMLIDVHTDFDMGCVYLDVLEEWMDTPRELVALREGFERALAQRSPDVAYGRRYPWQSAPSHELLRGMCAPAVESRFAVPALTLELPIGRYRDAAGRPGIWSPRHSQAMGRATARVLLESA